MQRFYIWSQNLQIQKINVRVFYTITVGQRKIYFNEKLFSYSTVWRAKYLQNSSSCHFVFIKMCSCCYLIALHALVCQLEKSLLIKATFIISMKLKKLARTCAYFESSLNRTLSFQFWQNNTQN